MKISHLYHIIKHGLTILSSLQPVKLYTRDFLIGTIIYMNVQDLPSFDTLPISKVVVEF